MAHGHGGGLWPALWAPHCTPRCWRGAGAYRMRDTCTPWSCGPGATSRRLCGEGGPLGLESTGPMCTSSATCPCPQSVSAGGVPAPGVQGRQLPPWLGGWAAAAWDHLAGPSCPASGGGPPPSTRPASTLGPVPLRMARAGDTAACLMTPHPVSPQRSPEPTRVCTRVLWDSPSGLHGPEGAADSPLLAGVRGRAGGRWSAEGLQVWGEPCPRRGAPSQPLTLPRLSGAPESY